MDCLSHSQQAVGNGLLRLGSFLSPVDSGLLTGALAFPVLRLGLPYAARYAGLGLLNALADKLGRLRLT